MLQLNQFFRPVLSTLSPDAAYDGSYHVGLVALSLLIASLSAFVAFSVAGRIAATSSLRGRLAWVLAGGFSMGGGIWGMHFIGMLAFTLPCGVGYDPIETVLSMVPGMLSSAAALSIIGRRATPGFGRLFGGALLMGGGIGAMHYSGMAAMRPQALLLYDPLLVLASVVIAVSLALLALHTHFRLRNAIALSPTVIAALASTIMGSAVAGMHYAAMGAADFYPADLPAGGLQLPPTLLAMLIALLSVLIASAVLAASYAGRQIDLVGQLSDEVRRRAAIERDLQRDRARTQAIVDSVADAIVTIDRNGHIQQWSQAAERTFGYTADEAVGRDITMLMPEPHRVRHPRYIDAFLGTREAKIIGIGRELTAIRKDGTEFPIDLTVTEVAGIDEVLFTGILRDITERKRSEQELIDARRQAEAASRAKTEFLATMSHEIRTPMNGVLGMVNLLAATPLNERQSRLTENLMRSGQALMGIINDVLDFSKVEAGRLELIEIDFEPREVLAEVADLFTERCAAKGLELICFIEEDVPTSLRGDPIRLRQCCVNLISNAIKFTERGEILVEMTLADDQPDHVMLSLAVVDSGIGIAPANRASVFDSFHQVDSSMTRRRGGSGLGLAIVKQLVELMGGNVGVDSELGRGSRFWFTVRANKTRSSTAPRGLRHLQRDLTVLLVDTNAVSGHVISHYLTSWGLEPHVEATVEDARAAWSALRADASGLDVLVIDAKGLGAPGLALAAEIRAADARTAVVLLAGLDGFGGDDAPPDVFATLSRPVRPSELFDCLASIASGDDRRYDSPQRARRAARSQRPTFDARVLVAEDNAVNQDVAVGMLTNMGCRVVTVPNGRAAVQAFASDRFDLILMDCEMPEMDGFEATKRIRETERLMNGLPENRERPGRIPIVAVTAHALVEMRQRCIDSGMDDFVTKPFDELQLTEALLRHLQPEGVTPLPIPIIDGAPHAAGDPLDRRVIDGLRTIEAQGSTNLLANVIAKFLQAAPPVLAELQTRHAAGDGDGLWRAAHKLKSSAHVLGAAVVAAHCGEIELASRRDGAAAVSAAKIAQLAADLAIATAALRAMLTGTDEPAR